MGVTQTLSLSDILLWAFLFLKKPPAPLYTYVDKSKCNSVIGTFLGWSIEEATCVYPHC